MDSRIVPVLMCGGAGTRLWPVSRESMPKQFVPLIGPRSTFQQVIERVSDPALFGRPIVITNADFRFIAAEQVRECGLEVDIVLEPTRRDSGPAVAAGIVRRSARDYAGVGGDEQGAAQARVPVRRADHGLRVHAGDGPGERPPGGMRRTRAADLMSRAGATPRRM